MKYLQRFYSYLLSQGGGYSHSLAIRVMSTLREGPVWSFREGPSASFDTKYFVWLLSFYKQKQVLFLLTIRWKKTMLRWFLRNNSCPTIFFKLSLNVPLVPNPVLKKSIKKTGHCVRKKDIMAQSYGI